MTELEFELIDELYFMSPYRVFNPLQAEEEQIQKALLSLIRRNYVNAYEGPDEPALEPDEVIEDNLLRYFYLATKLGLMAHNSR